MDSPVRPENDIQEIPYILSFPRKRESSLIADEAFGQQAVYSLTIPAEKTNLQNQIDATDRQIDKLVHELYGLTDDEIAIVEQATKK